MITASDLGRPALEAVPDDLLDEFGDQLAENYPQRDRFKCRGQPETGRHPPAWNWVFFEPLM